MILALKLIGGALLEYGALLLNPRVWLCMGVAGTVGFMRGCAVGHESLDEHIKLEEKVVAVQEGHRIAANARNKALQEEIDDVHAEDVQSLTDELAATQLRLRNRAARAGAVRGPSPGASEPVQPGCSAGEREFILAVYTGATKCYQAERLASGLRDIMGRALERSGRLAEPAVTALDDARWWGEWGRKVGACKVETP